MGRYRIAPLILDTEASGQIHTHTHTHTHIYIYIYIRYVLRTSRRMKWAGHVVRMGEERGCIGSCWGNRREGDHWGDLGVDG